MINSSLMRFARMPLFRYLFVGGIAFINEYVSFLFLYRHQQVNLIVANIASFGIGLATSFLFNRLWTFATGQYKRKVLHQFTFYIVLAVCNLLATVVIVSFLEAVGVNPNIGKLLAMSITSSWNFVLLKRIVFSHQDANKTNV